MKRFEEVAGFGPFIFWEYNLKCLTGVTVGYLLYRAFPEQSGQFLWVLLSILLSITHDNSSKVAFDRMKGNIVGSLVGLAAFFLHNPANLLTICIGVAATVTICSLLGLIGVVRTALVAFVIVVLYEQEHSSWDGAVYRVACVIGGCFIGLVINYVFRKIALTLQPQLPVDDTACDEDDETTHGESQQQ
jgi:uncharacterized membrane protein YccC